MEILIGLDSGQMSLLHNAYWSELTPLFILYRAAQFDPKYATPRTPTTSDNGEPAPPGESDPAPPGEEPQHNSIPSAKSNGIEEASADSQKAAAKKKQAADPSPSAVKQTADKNKLKAQTVKVLKSLLVKHELSTSGLKADLIKRLLEFYADNPTQVDDEVALKENANNDAKEASKNTTDEQTNTVIAVAATNQSSENEELENFDLNNRGSAPHLFEADDQPTPPGESPVKRPAKPTATAEADLENFEPSKSYPHLFRPERPVNAQAAYHVFSCQKILFES